MNTAIHCIILLACTAICTSALILKCQCRSTIRAVNRSLIADVTEYKPRPYCSNYEVIVTMKDKSSHCLDPNSDFTKAVLQVKQRQLAARANKMKATRPKTTTASATVVQTSSNANCL